MGQNVVYLQRNSITGRSTHWTLLGEEILALSEFEHQIAQYKKDNSGMEAWSYEETQKNL